MKRLFPVTILLVAAFSVSGCRSSAGSSPSNATPRPTAAPQPTALPGAPGVARLMASFDRAVVIGAMTSARSYLTPTLAAKSPPMVLPNKLRIPRIPRGARYTIRSVSARRATVDVTYRLPAGSVRDQLAIVRTHGMWRVAGIKPA